MTIVKEGPPQQKQHSCSVPPPRDHAAGTEWCCTGCHRLSILEEGDFGGQDYNYWRFETAKERLL